jgi:hypothetical protein
VRRPIAGLAALAASASVTCQSLGLYDRSRRFVPFRSSIVGQCLPIVLTVIYALAFKEVSLLFAVLGLSSRNLMAHFGSDCARQPFSALLQSTDVFALVRRLLPLLDAINARFADHASSDKLVRKKHFGLWFFHLLVVRLLDGLLERLCFGVCSVSFF